jgi:hypothetical protein
MQLDEYAIAQVFRYYASRSQDSLLRSLKELPSDALGDIIGRYTQDVEIKTTEDNLIISFNLVGLRDQISRGLTNTINDDVGILLSYGCSKDVVNEITGVSLKRIALKRQVMDMDFSVRGRPTKLDEDERSHIVDVWQTIPGSLTLRLIRTFYITRYPINDIWAAVRDNKHIQLSVGDQKCTKAK